MNNCFLAIDFDGTISEIDVTDAILQQYAHSDWLAVEELWINGAIGSQECLERQMRFVEADIEVILSFVDSITIDRHFSPFIQYVNSRDISHAVISDGFSLLIQRILANMGLVDIPVYANHLASENGILKVIFTNNAIGCPAGTCKCAVAKKLSQGKPVVLIGDGRSDFCLADKADFVFAKGELVTYCRSKGIAHSEFSDFRDIVQVLKRIELTNTQQAG